MFFKRYFKQNVKVDSIILGSRRDLQNQELVDRHRFMVEVINEVQGVATIEDKGSGLGGLTSMNLRPSTQITKENDKDKNNNG